MATSPVTRREFGKAIGTTLAAAVFTRGLPRSGERVPSDHESRRNREGAAIVIDSNENPYGPSPKALEAITESERVACRYPDAAYSRVKEAVARVHGVEPENVALGCGSNEILRAADEAFLGPDEGVVVAEPTFEAVLAYSEVLHTHAVKVPLTRDFRHDLPRMAEACASRTGVVYLCNPNNPTGTIVTREEMAEFFARVPATTVIVVDEAYAHFAENPKYASAVEWMGEQPNIVMARTFSKVYGLAGMRLGYAVGSKENIQLIRGCLTHDNGNAAVLDAALASLADPDHVPRCRKLIVDTRQWLAEQLGKQGHRTIPSEANFMMVDVGGDVQPVIEKLRDRNIFVGRKFPSLGNWLRVTIGTRPEMETFLAALNEIIPTGVQRAA